MDKYYTFNVTAHLFLHEDEPADYSDDTLNNYIETHKPYEALFEDLCFGFETYHNPKCIQSLIYDRETRTITATLQLLITPGSTFFPDSPDIYAHNLKDYILSNSFEDGCYGGDGASFILNDNYVGVFDIRKHVQVTLNHVRDGPCQEAYETEWVEEYKESAHKFMDSEALTNFKRYIYAPTEEKRSVSHDLTVHYLRREIYGLMTVFLRIEKSPFYNSDDERVTAFKHIASQARRALLMA